MLYRYAGPDGEGIGALPDGTGAAIGSEYCSHLLPCAEALRTAVAAAARRGIPLLLLTPYFRDAEIRTFVGLLRAVPDDAVVEVAVNDWGALLAARTLFPRLRLSIGRLLSGQKRCPRIGISTRLTPEGRAWHGEGLFSSRRAREYLRTEFGVAGFHVDLLEWGPPDAGASPGGGEGPPATLFIHGPYAIVTVSDACPWIGGTSSAAVSSCPRPCRGGTVILREPSMGREMIQRGKARFLDSGILPERFLSSAIGAPHVLYDEIP